MVQVYYILDIRNNSKEAMEAREYFSSNDSLNDMESVMHDTEDMHHPGTFQDTSRPDDSILGEIHGLSQIPHPQSSEFGLGVPFQNMSEAPEVPSPETIVADPEEDPNQIQASWPDFYEYFWTQGNWTDLAATSLNWMILDFTFYLLGVNSSSFVPTMFGESVGPSQPPYSQLISNERHIMEATSIGALIGGGVAIIVMNYFSRRLLQMWGFVVLSGLFVVVGSMYAFTKAHLGIVIFYGLCQLFFNLGEPLNMPEGVRAYS